MTNTHPTPPTLSVTPRLLMQQLLPNAKQPVLPKVSTALFVAKLSLHKKQSMQPATPRLLTKQLLLSAKKTVLPKVSIAPFVIRLS